jgi:hypothetical protein
VTNPHTPAEPRKRDESDQSAWDSMGDEGWLIRAILWAFALVIIGRFIWEMVK